MNGLAQRLGQLLDDNAPCALVEIVEAQGSTPREAGTAMVVTQTGIVGTIGGGQLEFHSIDRARDLLLNGGDDFEIDLALGPHLGQCCGGRVVLSVKCATVADVRRLSRAEANEHDPNVYVFGAGHTGLALVRALAPLPFRVTLVDDRTDLKPDLPEGIAFVHADHPESVIDGAPENSAFVILSHSHALDYALTDKALRAADAAYVGMIGSATKLARFRQWFRARGGDEKSLRRLVCPIGGKTVGDKRPAVIAALTANELIHRFFASGAVGNSEKYAENGTNRSGRGRAAA